MIETRPVSYRSSAGPDDATVALHDVLCDPDQRQGPPHRVLVPAAWQAVDQLPVDPDPEAPRICSLFFESSSLGAQGAVLMVSFSPTSLEQPQDVIARFAAFEGLAVDELHQERPGDVRAVCRSAERLSAIRVLRHDTGWLILSATAPVARLSELEEALHYALISLEPTYPTD